MKTGGTRHAGWDERAYFTARNEQNFPALVAGGDGDVGLPGRQPPPCTHAHPRAPLHSKPGGLICGPADEREGLRNPAWHAVGEGTPRLGWARGVTERLPCAQHLHRHLTDPRLCSREPGLTEAAGSQRPRRHTRRTLRSPSPAPTQVADTRSAPATRRAPPQLTAPVRFP